MTNIPEQMRVLTVRPGEPDSLGIEAQPVPQPGAGQALVRMLELGIDGTDNEVIEGGSGKPPAARERMIVGHESFGQVVAVSPEVEGLRVGDLVVATVRRPDPAATQPDLCLTKQLDMCPEGTYLERGIQGEDGYAAEYYVERVEYLIRVPPALRHVAVLTEPTSIALKGIERAWHFQSEFEWRPRKALVTGGSLALLGAMLLRERGLEVTFIARSGPESSKAKLVEAMGGRYVQSDKRPLGELLAGERFDFIFEGTGVPALVFQSLCMLSANGVLCAAGLPSSSQKLTISADCVGLEMVLGNRIFFGTVNSNRGHFERALEAMERLEKAHPGLLERVITGRLPLENYSAALNEVDIKNILVLDEQG
jgi:threonine dehydrogenase-like Zn-dependent dehydrogenase